MWASYIEIITEVYYEVCKVVDVVRDLCVYLSDDGKVTVVLNRFTLKVSVNDYCYTFKKRVDKYKLGTGDVFCALKYPLRCVNTGVYEYNGFYIESIKNACYIYENDNRSKVLCSIEVEDRNYYKLILSDVKDEIVALAFFILLCTEPICYDDKCSVDKPC